MKKRTNADAIVVEKITAGYGNDPVLQDVSLTIEKGTITSIIGPNGAGKTTLLKVLLGFLQPQKGTISIFGSTPKEARSIVGYVPQRLDFDTTFPIQVDEFLHFSAPNRTQGQLCDILEDLDIKALKDELLGTLSGGQLQRVLIARAMLHEPSILYLDEPAVGIDLGGEQDFYDIITHLHKEHAITAVMISHEVNLVQNFSDRIIALNHGRILVEGTPEEALTQETLEKLFGTRVTLFDHRSNQKPAKVHR